MLAMGAAVSAILGLLIRLTVRDEWRGVDVLFYVLQLPVVGLLLLLASAAWLGSGRRASALVSFVLSTAIFLSWVVFGRLEHSCGDRRADFRAVQWNLEYGRAGWDSIAAALREEDADVIGLVEAQVRGPNPVRFWRPRFPEYDVQAPGEGLVLMVRGEIETVRRENFGVRSRLAIAEVKVGGRPLRVILVDLEANWFSSRGPLIERVRAAALTSDRRPVLILGDFNTPGDSVWFRKLRRDYGEAFEAAGEGMPGTWPFFLHLMALDHLWVSRGLHAVCAEKRMSWLSDHSRIRAEVSFSKAPELPASGD